MTMKVDLKANEVVLRATDSKFHYDHTTVDGKLILTNQRLYFKVFDELMKHLELEFLPQQILEVLPFSVNLFAPKGLNLVTKDGLQYKFTMKNRNEWGALINKMY
jgi:hypothetical protein